MSMLPQIPSYRGYPGESDIAVASQQKALLLIVLILLLLADIGRESDNSTYEFFLQVISLLVAGVFCSANR